MRTSCHPGCPAAGGRSTAPIATAAVDRFMHHAHVVVTEGDSYRFAQARDGKGVTPLA
ncbi:ATP-binding protein [Egicoccus halophilus]|uniref:ATP-binding protein n=1 Tax=Egicoccus halophilus TaxID=1670830 RepID=UPI00351A8CEF